MSDDERGHEGGHEQVVRATKRLEGIGPPRLRLGPAELPGGSRPPSLLAIDPKCAKGVARTSLSRWRLTTECKSFSFPCILNSQFFRKIFHLSDQPDLFHRQASNPYALPFAIVFPSPHFLFVQL